MEPWWALVALVGGLGVVGALVAARRRRAGGPGPVLPPVEVVASLPAVSVRGADGAPPTEIVLGALDDPDITVRLAPPSDRGRQPVPLSPASQQALQPLLQQAPRVLLGGAVVGSVGVRLVLAFKPDSVRALASGALAVGRAGAPADGAFRAVAREAGAGRVVEQGQLLQHASPAAVALAVWQVASVLTAQKYLADIDVRLARIEQGLAEVRSLLEDQVVGALVGSLGYLRDKARQLQDPATAQAERLLIAAELERIDRDTRGLAEALALQLDRQPDELATESWGGAWFSAEQSVGRASARARRTAFVAQAALLASQVRLLVASSRAAVGLGEAYTRALVDGIEADLARHATAWSGFAAAFEGKVDEIRATFQRKDTDRGQQDSVRSLLTEANAELGRERELLAAAARELRWFVEADAARRPLELEVEAGPGGEVLSASRLLAP